MCQNAFDQSELRGMALINSGERNRITHVYDSADGQSLVEMALCLPCLLLIITGIGAFGLTLSNFVSLTDANSVGARQFAIQRGESGDPCALAVTAITSATPTLNHSTSTSVGIGYSFTVGGASYTTSCPSATMTQGQNVVVKTTYPCTLRVYSVNLNPNCQLVAQTTEVIQ